MAMKQKYPFLAEALRKALPIITIIGLVAGLIVDVLKPLANFAPYLLVISVIATLILLVGPFRKKLQEMGWEQALYTHPGRWQIFSAANVLVWAIFTVLSFATPKNGLMGSMSDTIKSIQVSVLHIRQSTDAIQEGMQDVQQTLDSIESDLEGSEGALITNPKTNDEWYHNAQIHQMNGNVSEAKKIFEKLFSENFSYVDAHENYSSLLVNSEGREAAKTIYQGLVGKNPSDPGLAMALAKLEATHEEKLAALKKVMEAHPDFAPVYLALAKQYESVGLGQLSSLEASQIKTLIEKFEELDGKGEFTKHFLDKSKLDEGRKIIGKLKQTYTIFKKDAVVANQNGGGIKIEVRPGRKSDFTFVPPEAFFTKILYSIDDPNKFIETGYFDFENPMTKQKMAKTMIEDVEVAPGQHIVYVKYLDLRGNESPVSKQEFTVK